MPSSASALDRGPAVLVPGRPEVDRPLRVLDPEPGGLQGRPEQRPASQVALPLHHDVLLVAQQRDHRRLHRLRHQHPGVLAHLQQLGHHLRVTGDEPGPVAGQVRALGQRVHGEYAVQPAARDVRVQHRDRLGVPAELPVALVRGHQRPPLPGVGHPAGQRFAVQDRPGRVGRRVQPDQGRPGVPQLGQVVGGDRRAPGQRRAHRVRRVGHGREDDQVTGPEPEQGGQPGHQLLGPDHRQRGLRGQPGRPPAAAQVPDDGGPQLRGARRERVARTVRRLGQRPLPDLRGRVDRGADGQVDDAVGMGLRPGLGPGEGVPGKVREVGRAATADRRGRHSSCSCGGSAAISGWSLSITPIFAAPPGEPRSSKKSTLAL